MIQKLSKAWILASVLSVVLIALHAFGLFFSWQLRLSDSLFLPRAARKDIVIIEIDNKSMQEIGRYPWDRSVHARLLNTIDAFHPKVIGFDITFFEPSAEDASFQQALLSAKTPVVLASEFDSAQNRFYYPIEEFLSAGKHSGIVNVDATLGADGVVRRIPLTKALQGKTETHFTGVVAQLVSPTLQLPETMLYRIHFVGPPGTFTRYSYTDVLNDRVSSSAFLGKIVLVGATAADLHDEHVTPVSSGAMPGVEIHANAIQNLLSSEILHDESHLETWLFIFVVAVLSASIFIFVPLWSYIPVILGIAVLYILTAIWSFEQGVIRNLVYPVLSLGSSSVLVLLYRYQSEIRQKMFIRKAFSYYLSDAVMKEVLANPKMLSLGGKRRELTVLFSDIAGFTTYSEKAKPEELAHKLNEYLTNMTNIILNHRGVVDKYIGDAIMAFWGAPVPDANHALAACKTALLMRDVQSDFVTRIGVHTGDMVVGNMGSDKRFDYTVIGDNVNLTSRLEGLNKQYGTRVITTHVTYDIVKKDLAGRRLDTVAVKGKKTGIEIYELIGVRPISESTENLITLFEEALLLYEKGQFKKALKAFEEVSSVYPEDEPTKIFIDRCKELIKTPPKNWDGIYRATSK